MGQVIGMVVIGFIIAIISTLYNNYIESKKTPEEKKAEEKELDELLEEFDIQLPK